MTTHEPEMKKISDKSEHTDIPKVSVIVPVYNPGSGFDRCLKSLRTQTLTDIEILFVDDCGTDGAMDKARAAAAEDSRIRIITNPENIGHGPSCNRGIEAARGKYLSFVDSDDYLSPDFLELLYIKASGEGLDIAKGTRTYTDEGGNPAADQWGKAFNDKIRTGLENGKPLYLLFPWNLWSAIYRASFVLETGARFGISRRDADVTFLLRLCSRTKSVGIDDRAVYHYCVGRKGANSCDILPNRLDYALLAFAEQVDHVAKHLATDEYAPEYIRLRIEDYLLGLHRTFEQIHGCEMKAAAYLEGIRALASRLPFADALSRKSAPCRALIKYGVNLCANSYFPPGSKQPKLQLRLDEVTRWADFMLTHPELSDEYGRDLQQVLKRAANTTAEEMKCGPRIDVKIYGTKDSTLELRGVSGKDARVTTPVWLHKLRQPGTGYVIEPCPGQTAITLDFACKTAGEFTATLRGADVRDSNGKQIPKWVTYTGLTCNGEIVFEGGRQVWHDQPYRYKKTVQAGDAVKMEIYWRNGDNDA